MAETLVYKILGQLTPLLSQEASLVICVRKEVEKLQSNMKAIQAVISDAERRQWKEDSIKQWLDKLKDVSYDIDDALDEWSTAMLKATMKETNDEYASSSWVVRVFVRYPFLQQVGSFVSCFYCIEIGVRYDVGRKIKELNQRLDVIASEKDTYRFNLMQSTELPERQITTSFVDVTEVKGREEEKRAIIDMLLSESSERPSLLILSLLGMGGIGKTTLARLIYNDHEVETHFEKRIWVCVSDPFDEKRIARAILESLTDPSVSDLAELQTIMQRIQAHISRKRFLLVLDDVWTEDYSKWEQLKNSLQCGLPGSTIILTTRKENVANSMASSNTVRLRQLSSEECWSVFSRIAFSGCEDREQLEQTGRKIAAKCKGLPLAAKTLGSLCFRKSREELQNILDSEIWELEEAEVDLFPHLWLSYYDLPSVLRRCFLYCAIFPKDYRIEKHKLIESWMAHGYLTATRINDMEKIGEKYFRALAMRCFFQDYEDDKDDGSITACQMHDIVHDFAQFLTKNEFSVMEADGFEGPEMDPFYREARHSRIVLADVDPLLIPLNSLKRLHSLKVQCRRTTPITRVHLTNFFNEMTCLRSLDLSNCDITEIPSTISKLVHLRQLDLSLNFRLRELPETICELVSLQTLNVYCGSDGFTKLPSGIGKLIHLRHLHNSPNILQPKSIARLTCLRTLGNICLGYGGEDFSLADLKNLNCLQGKLSIEGLSDQAEVSAARQAELKRKTQITSFSVYFGKEETERRMHHDEELVEALEPSPNLTHLSIYSYQGTTVCPSWLMSLTNLTKLHLSSCFNCKHLPPLGKLPSLEDLDLFRLYDVEKLGVEFLGMNPQTDNYRPASSSSSLVVAFPKLTHLSFARMISWEEWDDGKNRDEGNTSCLVVMPSLCSLSIIRCSQLKALPNQLLQKARLGELSLRIKRSKFLRQRYQDIAELPNVNIW